MGDIIGLNHLAVWKDIEEYEKECGRLDKWKIFNKIVKLFYHMRIKQDEWSEIKKEKKEKQELESKVGKEAVNEVYNSQGQDLINDQGIESEKRLNSPPVIYILKDFYRRNTMKKEKKNLCLCGCGEEVKPNRKYINGHYWNGRKHTEESKKKMSDSSSGENASFLGKTHTVEVRQKIRESKLGERNPNFGKTISEYQKEKIRNAVSGSKNVNYKGGNIKTNCSNCNKVIEKKRAKFKNTKNSFCDHKCHNEWMEINQCKENNPNWHGGSKYKDYNISFNNKLKTIIRERDGFICQICSKHEDEFIKSHSIHHIDYNKQNSSVKNLVALCNSCHSETNGNREYWTNHLKYRINYG